MGVVKRAAVLAPLPHVPAGAVYRVPVRGKSATCLLQTAGKHQAAADEFHATSLNALLEQIKVNLAFRVSLRNEATGSVLNVC
jgi:hypothetical protein